MPKTGEENLVLNHLEHEIEPFLVKLFKNNPLYHPLSKFVVMSQVTDDLIDYEDEVKIQVQPTKTTTLHDSAAAATGKEVKKGSYVGIHSTSFRDFLLKPELLRAIGDCGFEHPSEVQQECIPQAILGMDVLCQAKSGMGKTAVFVLASLQQLEVTEGEVSVLVLCHTRELAFQIKNEYTRFLKYMPGVHVEAVYGGINVKQQRDELKSKVPNIIVATPGRILALVKEKSVSLKGLKCFILDECDKMLEPLGTLTMHFALSLLSLPPSFILSFISNSVYW